MKFQRRHSVDNSLFKPSEAPTSHALPEEATPPPPSSSARPRIQRRHSLTSVVSLGLIAGSSAFTTPQASGPASSAFRPQIARTMSDKAMAGQATCTSTCTPASRPQMSQMARSKNDRGLVTSNMLPVDAAMDVASGVSQTASSILGDSSILASKISSTELVASALFGVARNIFDDDKAKSELLTDFSHVAGDLIGFVTPNQTTLKAGMVVGRIFSIMADYLPDQMINPEEAVFQACMLGVSTSILVKHVKPMISAHLQPASFQEKRAYQGLFRQFGLSWVQFKSVTSAAADWVELAPNEELGDGENGEDDDDYFYWTYKGEADLIKNDRVIQQGHDDLGLLGEDTIARKLQQRNRRRNSNIRLSKAINDEMNSSTCVPSKVRAGSSGAKLLRINTTKLLELMDNDDQLSNSINDMILAGMQEKLSSMYLEPAVA